MNIGNEAGHLKIPLGIEAHRIAKQFASEQVTQQKRKQVYLNTLAVYAVHRYLQWLKIETDLSQSDSWHPVLCSRWDVADLLVPGIGKLECRPVLPGETVISLPLEATEDRIGYLGVQFSEQLDQAELLGFAEAVNASAPPRQLLVSELQPLETLLNYLEWRQGGFSSSLDDPEDQPSHIPLEVVNFGLLRGYEINKGFPNKTWKPLLDPSPISAMRRSSNEEFSAIARKIRQSDQIEIPFEAIGAYQDIEVDRSLVRLYVVTWLIPDAEVREWALLLVLNTTSRIDPLQEIQLQVSDQTGVLAEEILKQDGNQPYRIVQAVGTLDEKFLVTIASVNGEGQTSRLLFGYSPEQRL